ncbi:steroid hormone receptor ERR2-like [Diadema antillarum]|uniref:steroid hormone receptor ERR2-like n=1 Tax=Diadema antillarum TaxID=105358 RepID=UPI003A88D729
MIFRRLDQANPTRWSGANVFWGVLHDKQWNTDVNPQCRVGMAFSTQLRPTSFCPAELQSSKSTFARPDRRPGGQKKIKDLPGDASFTDKLSASSSSWRQPRRDVEQLKVDTNLKGAIYYQSLDADVAEPWKLAIHHPDGLISHVSSIAGAKEDFETAGNPIKSIHGLSGKDVIQVGYNELLMIIEWAKGIGGFRSLLMEDQMSINTYPLIRYTDKYTLTEAESKELGWGEACEATMRFCSTLVELKLILLNSAFCRHWFSAFLFAFPGDHNRRYGKLLMRLPSLRKVSTRSMEQILSLKLEGKIDIHMGSDFGLTRTYSDRLDDRRTALGLRGRKPAEPRQ